MGTWFTGINMGISLQKNGIVKNTGPESIAKNPLHSPLLRPGVPVPDHRLPAAFLKPLLTSPRGRISLRESTSSTDWRAAKECPRELRDYLLRRFARVCSGYGATDLESGFAGETPVSIAIRRLAREREDVKARADRLGLPRPMVFQYNPVMHHIEVNENDEVILQSHG